MKRLLSILILLAAFILPAGNGLADTDSYAVGKLRWEINKAINESSIDRENIGIKVFSLKNNDVLFSNNSERPFIPASNIKLITSAAALVKLYPDYTFKTKLFLDGEVSHNILKGNLYLKGFGDPLLVTERLLLIARDVHNRGIKKINGDIVIDDYFFDGKRSGIGWKKNRGPQAYNAPIGAASLNFNVVTVYIEPGERVGAKARVIIDPKTDYTAIDNRTVTTQAKTRRRLYVDRVTNGKKDKIVIGGKMPINSKRISLYRNISHPPLYLGMAFKEFLMKEGIQVKGSVRVEQVPETAKELSQYESRALFRIIQYLNKFSNNFVAEQILKTLGAEIKGEPGTFEKGIEAVKEFLDDLGIKRDSYVIADGSGLSRLNRLTPDQIIRVLTHMYNNFQVQGEYLSSLGVMGVDGSVDDRLENTIAKRKVRAKTGTLFGVTSISGYVQSRSHEVLAFSILINQKKSGYYSGKKLQNKVLLLLANFQR